MAHGAKAESEKRSDGVPPTIHSIRRSGRDRWLPVILHRILALSQPSDLLKLLL